MRKLTSRETFLIIVVVGLFVIGWIYGRGGNLGGGGAADPDLKPLTYADPPIVELARLGLEADNYDSATRNLFAYYVPPPPPRPKPKPVVKPPPPKPQATAPARQAPRPQLPPQKPKPPRPTFRYIGFMGPKDNKIAVLEKGDEIMLASVGEVLEKQYKVVEFKYEILVVGYTDERWVGQTTELPMKH